MGKTVAIGFIGLGVMGEAMCRNLCLKLISASPNGDITGSVAERVDPLFSIHVFDISTQKTESFAEFGAVISNGIAELAEACEFILLSLPGGDELVQVLSSEHGVFAHARAGTTIVDLSTSPVELTRNLSAKAMAKGLRYVDSPVARTRKAAETGTLAMSVGGEAADVDRVLPILECMASDVMHVGEVGCGQLVKILNNMVLFQTVNALAEAQTLASRFGMDTAQLFDALEQGSADSFALRQHGRNALLPGEFPIQAFSVAYAKKDLKYALELAKSSGADITGAEHIDRLFDTAIAEGKEDQYWPVIGTLLDD